MSGVIRKSANGEGPEHPPVYLWRDLDTGERFIVSPLTGAVAPVGKGFGRPGRSGRKPKVFKEFCNDMLRDPAVQERLRDLAVNGAPDDAMRAINTAAKYSQPLPRQEIDQSSRLEVYISGPPDESVMGKEDEDRRRRTARSLRDAWA
jgi:hypothetical protein